MSTFGPAFLDELRNRLTLSEVIGRRVKITRAGREFKACCPFHKEKSPSFTINDAKGFFHCFGCGAHGDVIGFTMRQENRSFPEAVEILAGMAGMQVPKSSPEEAKRYEEEKNLYTLIDEAARWFEEQLRIPSGRMALEYAKRRNLSQETIDRFRLGYAPNDAQALIKYLTAKGYKPQQMVDAGVAKKSERDTSKDGGVYSFFRGRLIFPVGDRRGRVVAFGARLLEGDGPKYINSADHGLFHKGQLLYGFSRARAAAADGKPLIITEGYMDVIRLVEAGFMGAVAPLGTALTEEQIQLLWKIVPKPPVRPDLLNHIPILCFDGDNAGSKAAERALERILPHLAPDQSVRFAAMPAGEDPDTLILNKGPAAMQAVLDAAQPLIDFMWQRTAGDRPLNTPEDRAGFRRALDARIGLIKDRALQQDYKNSIQERLQQSFSGNDNRPQQQRFEKRDASKSYGRSFMPVIKPRPLPNNLQERIVLALLINHPALFVEMESALDTLPITDASLEPLRQGVFDFMSESNMEHENPAALREFLEKAGLGQALSRVLSPDLYVHAGFARPERPLSAALAGWHDIWNRHERISAENELKNLSLELKSTGDSAILERIEQLQAMLIHMDEKAEREVVEL